MDEMQAIELVWNGCDGYVEVDEAVRRGYDIVRRPDGTAALYTQREGFASFGAVEISAKDVPIVDGELDYDGIFMTESGRVYRAV